MSDIMLKVEHVSKQYRLGLVGTGTLSHDLKRWFYRIRGKEDPFLKIGDTNDRSTKGDSKYVWALKDINFEVKKGEVLGIIGKNGAGKSTLLKILSRVTSPSTGEIKTKGRIASLLEVGTGFHPELTGKENIYLNGAILGMTKAEIKTKEEEIIEFSGCERYIDTPVKRYSSGMRVRLAFAVAAFLEPDILVVDEVLAVGDAEFQKKAIGKMQDISKGEGRTVLFVSHNMAAVKSLCSKTMVLKQGKNLFSGDTNKAINLYLEDNSNQNSSYYKNKIKSKSSDIIEIEVLENVTKSNNVFGFNEAINIRIDFYITQEHLNKTVLGFRVRNKDEISVFISQFQICETVKDEGRYSVLVSIPPSILAPNSYTVTLGLHIPNQEIISRLQDVVHFIIEDTGTEYYKYHGKDIGCVILNCDWKLKALNNEET